MTLPSTPPENTAMLTDNVFVAPKLILMSYELYPVDVALHQVWAEMRSDYGKPLVWHRRRNISQM